MRALTVGELREFDERVAAMDAGQPYTWTSGIFKGEHAKVEEQTAQGIAYRFGIKVSDVGQLREERGL